MDQAFADRLKELRTRMGFTQADLAARLEVSQGVVSRWEKARHKPNERILLRLSELAGVAPAELRYGPGVGLAGGSEAAPAASSPKRRRLTDLLQDCIVRARHSGKSDVAVALEVILDKCWADALRSERARRTGDPGLDVRPSA